METLIQAGIHEVHELIDLEGLRRGINICCGSWKVPVLSSSWGLPPKKT